MGGASCSSKGDDNKTGRILPSGLNPVPFHREEVEDQSGVLGVGHTCKDPRDKVLRADLSPGI